MVSATTFTVATIALGGFLVAAAVSDVRARRVRNPLNLAIGACGVLFAVVTQGGMAAVPFALGGVALALAIWFPMFALRLMGAGDVKLLAACGAWLGWQGVVVASLATGVFGGVLGALWLLRTQGAWSAMHAMSTAVRMPWLLKMRPFEARERLPYAVAVAAGVATAWWWQHGTMLQEGW
jgi:prepilin peptidase CpaA